MQADIFTLTYDSQTCVSICAQIVFVRVRFVASLNVHECIFVVLFCVSVCVIFLFVIVGSKEYVHLRLGYRPYSFHEVA